ncbi:hypothetical protein RRG08_064560 [Elysia crispata]|uniref:Uncharacterized protein n=1 Tax=Elysia crispata TaxID=231223 RepID=A0AAE1BAS8_9GAST|nr:hypothetical protein RRG08_064560 [Elysia crispata]
MESERSIKFVPPKDRSQDSYRQTCLAPSILKLELYCRFNLLSPPALSAAGARPCADIEWCLHVKSNQDVQFPGFDPATTPRLSLRISGSCLLSVSSPRPARCAVSLWELPWVPGAAAIAPYDHCHPLARSLAFPPGFQDRVISTSRRQYFRHQNLALKLPTFTVAEDSCRI